jgi:hypothetical protein
MSHVPPVGEQEPVSFYRDLLAIKMVYYALLRRGGKDRDRQIGLPLSQPVNCSRFGN